MLSTTTCDNQTIWDKYVNENGGHPLQLWGWGELKSLGNWGVTRIFIQEAGEPVAAAQVLWRSLAGGILAYIPRGPVIPNQKDRARCLEQFATYCKEQLSATVLKIEPDWTDNTLDTSWKSTSNTILIPKTATIDLSQSEDDILSKMHKKTRQYIRKSSRDNVTIKLIASHDEIKKCLQIYHQTAQDAHFRVHKDDYYYNVAKLLGENSEIYAAFYDKKIVAFLWLVTSQATAFELYGGVNNIGQEKRVNYALKWHAITESKKQGVKTYDMNGLLNDGISKFKEGFVSGPTQLIGTYDHPLSPKYTLWNFGILAARRVRKIIK